MRQTANQAVACPYTKEKVQNDDQQTDRVHIIRDQRSSKTSCDGVHSHTERYQENADKLVQSRQFMHHSCASQYELGRYEQVGDKRKGHENSMHGLAVPNANDLQVSGTKRRKALQLACHDRAQQNLEHRTR